MPVQASCQIQYKDQLNPHAVRMDLAVGDMVERSFRAPGQFVHIKCGDGLLLRRPISVCACGSEPHDPDWLTVVFEVRGAGTAWLAQRQEGETLDVMGLLGNGFSMEPQGHYLLVGGGIGIPPLLGCAQYADGNCHAVLGARDSSHMLLLNEFSHHCPTVAVATEDGSMGEKGFVTGPMEALLKQNHYDAVLCCGPKPMLKSAAALAERYQVPCQVSMEERMGCGVGACLVCACDMADGSKKHVCKDGPVFDAREVDWNG